MDPARDDHVTPVRVVIADDHSIVREGLRNLIDSMEAFEVVGEAVNGAEAVALALDLQPDLVVMDLNMPVENGITATRRIIEAHPRTGILVLTMFDDDQSLFEALQAGARAYVLKGAARADLERALVSCAHGDAVFGPEVASRVLRHFEQPAVVGPSFPDLTHRERRVLDLIARGTTTAAIASQLAISPKTVRNHTSNIFTKLHVSSRADAIIRAREGGLGASGT
jgi:DNA-binding NarL/FixJ family response regulator